MKAYARNPDASAEATFRGALKSSNEEIQSAAANGLAIMAGVADGGERAYENYRNNGFDSLSKFHQHYVAVNGLDYHVTNSRSNSTSVALTATTGKAL